jgi:hypothetical protein
MSIYQQRGLILVKLENGFIDLENGGTFRSILEKPPLKSRVLQILNKLKDGVFRDEKHKEAFDVASKWIKQFKYEHSGEFLPENSYLYSPEEVKQWEKLLCLQKNGWTNDLVLPFQSINNVVGRRWHKGEMCPVTGVTLFPPFDMKAFLELPGTSEWLKSLLNEDIFNLLVNMAKHDLFEQIFQSEAIVHEF